MINVLNKKMSVQMLDLMAERAGSQALGLRLKPRTVPVLCPNTHPVGTGHDTPLAGDAEAPLQSGLLAALRDNFRVDQLQKFLALLVQHQTYPAQHTHLRCRQPGSVGVRQCLRHIIQQTVQPPVKFFHRAAHLCQTFIALFYDFPQCHDSAPPVFHNGRSQSAAL